MLELSAFIYTSHRTKYTLSGQYNGVRSGIDIGYHSSGLIHKLTIWYSSDNVIMVAYYPNDLVGWLAHWRYGVRHGIEVDYRPNGLVGRLIHWRYGVRHGIEVDYRPNCLVSRLTHWRYGVRHGIEVDYRPNGLVGRLTHWLVG